MEGIETVDAILSPVYPKTDFEKKDREREKRAKIDIERFKMDSLEKLRVSSAPISLIIDSKKKL